MNNKPEKKEIIEVIKNILHIGFGSLPKNKQNAITNYHIMDFLDGLLETAEEIVTEDKK